MEELKQLAANVYEAFSQDPSEKPAIWCLSGFQQKKIQTSLPLRILHEQNIVDNTFVVSMFK